MPDAPSKPALAEGLTLALVALACIAFQVWLPTTHVKDNDYQAAVEVLNAHAQPGDVLLLNPWWSERARLFIPESVPVVGYLGSDADPLELNPRIWVLEQPNLPEVGRSQFWRAFSQGRTELSSEIRLGNLSLRLYKNGRARPVLFDARARLAEAKVYLELLDGSRQSCQWSGHSHRCPNGAEVLTEWRELKYQPRQCVRFFPPAQGAKLVAEFANLPAADSVVLMGGYIWEHAVHLGGVTRSDLGLEVNGETSTIPLPPGTDGLQRVEHKSSPAGSTVRVWVTAPNPADREVCFELYAFGAATP